MLLPKVQSLSWALYGLPLLLTLIHRHSCHVPLSGLFTLLVC
ncbi:unnamed protein product [Staurois parvus]|uniref:Uncharacterized protein n=1 Tax=Staurois parvus TaxID=386267 RepID=A0ABN9CYV2_9NEOB|nr:unnamed protein product [Staurois parvus]